MTLKMRCCFRVMEGVIPQPAIEGKRRIYKNLDIIQTQPWLAVRIIQDIIDPEE